jgi:hypothetical protein
MGGRSKIWQIGLPQLVFPLQKVEFAAQVSSSQIYGGLFEVDYPAKLHPKYLEIALIFLFRFLRF